MWLGWVAWGCAILLLYLALRQTPIDLTWNVLRSLGWQQIILVLGLNLIILSLLAARWWSIVRVIDSQARLTLVEIFFYRLGSFGISFFTPGPQFGGEPVQVDLLYRRNKVPVQAALSSVYLDRLLDLLTNFTFLALGIVVIGVNQLSHVDDWVWILLPVVSILVLPSGHLVALAWGKYPVSSLLNRISKRFSHPWIARSQQVVLQAESDLARLCRTQIKNLLWWIVLSVMIWCFMIFEYWLTLVFLGASPTFLQTIYALTAGRLALLTPLPGGLGILETSQVLASQILGWGSQVGLALSAVIRARDLLFALTGLGLVLWYYRNLRPLKGLPAQKFRPNHADEHTGSPGNDKHNPDPH